MMEDDDDMVIQAQNVVSPHELPLLDDVVAKS